MPCTLVRYPEVTDNEGNKIPSKLFVDLLERTKNIPVALYYWSEVRKPEFLQSRGNWMTTNPNNLKLDENGEFSIDNFKVELRDEHSTKPIISYEAVERPSRNIMAGMKEALVGLEYIEEIKNSVNKRWVVSNFFRYKGNTKPYFPFTTGNYADDIELVRKINDYFDGKAVTMQNDKIVFTNFIDNLSFKIESPQFMEQKTILQEDKGIDSEILDEKDGYWGDEDDDLAAFAEPEPSTKSLGKMFGNYQTLINRRKEMVRVFKSRKFKEAQTGEVDRGQRLELRILGQEESITILEKNLTNTAFKKVIGKELTTVEGELDAVKRKISEESTPEELIAHMAELSELSYYIKNTVDIDSFLASATLEQQEEVDKLQIKALRLQTDYLATLKLAFINYANKTSFRKDFDQSIFAPLKDADGWDKFVKGLYMAPSELLQVVDDVIDQAVFSTEEGYAKKRLQIEKEIKLLEKETGLKGHKLWVKFMQHDKHGEWTGNYIHVISDDFFRTRDEMRAKASESGKWNIYYNWLKENQVEMTESMATEGSSDLFSAEDHKKQDRLLESFKQNRMAFEESLMVSDIYTDEDSNFWDKESKKAFDAEMDNWDHIHSPHQYWAQQAGTIRRAAGRKGYMYILDAKPKETWKDERFLEIENNPSLLRFYNFMHETFHENRNYLPPNRELQTNYLPENRKAFLEKSGRKTIEVFGLLSDQLLMAISDNLEEEISSTITIGGKKIRSVPIRMMNNRLDIAEKSMNLPQILLENTKMALNYKFKTLIEPLTNASVDLLDNMDQKKTVEKKDRLLGIKNLYGGLEVEKNQLAHSKKWLEHTINATMYDLRKQIEGRSNIKIYTRENKKIKAELAAKLKAGTISKSEHDKLLDEITRQVTVSALTDSLVKYTYIKALSFPNIVSPTVNVMFGLLSNFTYSSAGQDVTDKNLLKATTIMMGVMMGKRSFVGKHLEKVYAFMDSLKILADVNESNYGSRATMGDKLVFLQAKAEYLNQGSMMLGILFTTKVLDKNGNEVSIYDAYKMDEDGLLEWDTEKMGKEIKPKAHEIVGEAKKGVGFRRLRRQIKGINDNLHGDYDAALYAKSFAAGRVLMLFKTWLPMSISHRFAAEYYNPKLQRRVKGRYRSYLSAKDIEGKDVHFLAILQKLAAGFVLGKRHLKDFDEIDRINLTRNIRELHFIGVMTLATILLLQIFGGGDDEPNPEGLNVMLNTFGKALDDMMLFMNPSSMTQIIDNVVPLMATVKDVIQLNAALFDMMTGETRYVQGPWKGHLKAEPWIYKNIPGVNFYPRVVSMGQRIYE